MIFQKILFYAVGVGFLGLAKSKNILKGYSSPKPFDMSEIERCIEYDISVVEHWLTHLQEYGPDRCSLVGKNILELGPGSDLGIGIYLLSKGCLQYNACDVNNLMQSTPDEFYEQLFEKVKCLNLQINIGPLKSELQKLKEGKPSRLNYMVRDDFDIEAAFGKATIDVVFSQAAFEHFEDINSTISKLSSVCKPGAILVAEIDLKTHSRWIRDKDPNNIYRYPKWIYEAFAFRGIPNRNRPLHYKEALERHGWSDVKITPLAKITDYAKAYSGMHKAFTDERNQMDLLSFMICARKK